MFLKPSTQCMIFLSHVIQASMISDCTFVEKLLDLVKLSVFGPGDVVSTPSVEPLQPLLENASPIKNSDVATLTPPSFLSEIPPASNECASPLSLYVHVTAEDASTDSRAASPPPSISSSMFPTQESDPLPIPCPLNSEETPRLTTNQATSSPPSAVTTPPPSERTSDPTSLTKAQNDFFKDFCKILERFDSYASQLAVCPKDHLANRRLKIVVKQFNRYYVPLLEQLFGSLKDFLKVLAHSERGKTALKLVARSKLIDDVIKEELPRFAPDLIQEWRDKEQEHHDSVSDILYKTVIPSTQSYRMMNDLLVRETPESAQERARARLDKPTESRLPVALRNIPKFLASFKAEVEKQGGGFSIKAWKRFDVSKILDLPDVEQSAIDYFHAQGEVKGWIMKGLYELATEPERTTARMEHLRKIAAEYGGDPLSQQQWKQITEGDARWEGLKDCAFLADLWYRRRCAPVYWRRGEFKIDGIAVTGPSNLSLVRESIRDKGLSDTSLSTQEAFRQFLEEDKFPVGTVFETTVSGTADGEAVPTEHVYKGRRAPLRFVLAYLVAQAIKHKLLRADVDVYDLEYGIWMDGATALGHPLVVDLAFLVRNPKFCISSHKLWVDALRHYPVSIGFSHESIDSITQEMEHLGKELLSLEPLQYDGKTYNLKFSVLTGDNSALSKMIGNSCGGFLRCPHCSADFSNEDSLWSYAHLRTCRTKTFASLLEQLGDSTSGIVRESGIFLACKRPEDKKKMLEILKDCKLAVDPLHNIKGHLKTIMDCLKQWKYFDEAIFVKNLGDFIQRKSVSDLDGAHMRLLAEMYREAILPALTACPAEIYSKVEELFEGWSEVRLFMLGKS